MKATCLLLLVVLVCVAVSKAQTKSCNYGERYFCGSAACEKSCATLDDTTPCTEPCQDGCYCAHGYIRNPYRTCSSAFVCRYKSIVGLID